jgi:hypothetical protein
MRWSHYIEDTQIYPFNSRSLKGVEKLENELLYAYRKEVEGDLLLTGKDYLFLKGLELNNRDDKFTYEVKENGIVKFTREFTIFDCDFDDYKKTVSIKTTLSDAYTTIQENEDIEVNIIEGATSMPVGIAKYSYYVFKLYYSTVLGATAVPSQSEFETLVRTRIVEYKKLGTFYITGVGTFSKYLVLGYTERMEMTASEYAKTEFTDWTKLVEADDYNVYERYPEYYFNLALGHLIWRYSQNYNIYKDTIDANPNNYNIVNFAEVNDATFGSTGNEFDVDETLFDDNAFTLYVLKSGYNGRANIIYTPRYRGYELRSVLDRILTYADPNFTGVTKSTFLFGDEPESGKTVPSSYADFAVYSKCLIEINDFQRPSAKQPSSLGVLTDRKVIEYLCGKFNLFWHIDSEGNRRLEHISYYQTNDSLNKSSDLNLTLKYRYLKDNKPNREYLEEALGYNEDFQKIEVLYGNVPAKNGMKEDTRTKSLAFIYTDIDGLNTHFSDLPNEGFILVDVFANSVVKGTGFKSTDTLLQNVKLSNANCLNLYYRHNAFQREYSIGGIQVESISLRKMKLQELEFTHNSIPDTSKKMTSRIGTGEFISLEYPLVEENKFKAELLYE